MASKKGPLREHLEEEWKAHHSGTPTLSDLWQFDTRIGRDAFARYAAPCEALWRRPAPPAGAPPGSDVNLAETFRRLEKRFARFDAYLKREMLTPLDFFTILRWAREPSMPELRKNAAWPNVWEELYLLVVAHGHTMALVKWNHHPTQLALSRLTDLDAQKKLLRPARVFEPGSQDWGFHPKDAELVYLPFIDPGAKARGYLPDDGPLLLRARLVMRFRNDKNFGNVQRMRRAAAIYAMFRGLTLLNEAEAISLAEEMRASDPLKAANRVWQTTGLLASKYRINEEEKNCFAVAWIDSAPSVYVELPPFPGHLFRTFRRGDLSALAHDNLFKLVGRSLAEVGAFLVAYLVVLGFVVDVITAGAASTTLRGLVYNFIKEKLIEAAADKGLDVLKIENFLLRQMVQAGVGMKTAAAARKPKTLANIERKDANVMLVPPRGGTTDHFAVRDPGSGGGATPKLREKIRKAAKLRYADESIIGRAKDKLAARTDGRAEALGARMAAVEGRGLSMPIPVPGPVSRVAGAPGSKGAGIAGASPKEQRQARNMAASAARFENSEAYQTAGLYRDFVPNGKALLSARHDIASRLASNPDYTMKEANHELRALINKAKEDSGEEQLLVDIWGRYSVEETLAIPTRGDGGVVMLDVAVRLKEGEKYWFVLGEAKGNTSTAYGWVTAKTYKYDGDILMPVTVPGDAVRQGSAKWYYQKFAEIYRAGQRRDPPDKRVMNLALELIDAAKKGKIRYEVLKTSPDVAKHIDDTAIIAEWFSKNLVPGPKKGMLPIPKSPTKK